MENKSNLKNLFLAVVGGTAMTYDRAQDILDDMIERGKVSVKEGKALSEDLKRTIKREAPNENYSIEPDALLMEEIIGLRKDINQLTQRVDALEENQTNEDETL
ncbi:hypothetical protein HZY86_05805 [Aerococcaceae bacterium DSM 111020]|nr:hypothetical protein [Aerococcaceae bacterium DSM 111020]